MVRRERVEGSPLAVGGLTVTPEAERIWVDLPFWRGLWHRPTAILVEDQGETRRVPVLDVTRQGQLVLVAATGLVSCLGWLILGFKRREK